MRSPQTLHTKQDACQLAPSDAEMVAVDQDCLSGCEQLEHKPARGRTRFSPPCAPRSSSSASARASAASLPVSCSAGTPRCEATASAALSASACASCCCSKASSAAPGSGGCPELGRDGPFPMWALSGPSPPLSSTRYALFLQPAGNAGEAVPHSLRSASKVCFLIAPICDSDLLACPSHSPCAVYRLRRVGGGTPGC